MDTKILTLLVVIGLAGGIAESLSLQQPYARIRRNGPPEAGGARVMAFAREPRVKREIGESNGESENSNKTESSTPPSGTKPTTTPEPTTKPASSSTTPKPTPPSSPPTPKPTAAPTPMSTPAVQSTTTVKSPESNSENPSASEPAPNAPGIGSRSGFETPKPSSFDSYPGFPSNNNLYRGRPAFNSIPGVDNYSWTQTSNNGPSGFAGASAGSFASAGASAGSAAYPGPSANAPNFGTRGAFAEPSPYYPQNGGNAPGPSYNSQNSFGYPSDPGFGGDPFSFQRAMEEHFRRMQAEFEQQHRAALSQHLGSFGGNAHGYSNAASSASSYGGFRPSGGVHNRFLEASNGLGGGDGYYGNSNPGAQSAYSSINLGPRGGFQTGAINPAAPGVESRFAEDVPAPSGNSFGVFSSSSSSSRTGPDGKTISHKQSTTGVNDNGKITFRTVED